MADTLEEPLANNPSRTSAHKPLRNTPKGTGKSGNPAAREIQEIPKARLGDWINGARPFTLSMAVAPVAIGTGAAIFASDPGVYHWVRALLCLVIAVALQIGVNFANDYSDGIRGTDQHRVGPSRLVGSGRAPARKVFTVAMTFFGIAAVAGLAQVIISGIWWLLIVGVLAIVAAWYYTGGKRPYGYMGLGELFVFVFFGLVATLGTTYVQIGAVTQPAIAGGIAVGFIAVATLMVNNLRDIEQDKIAGKRTLSVRIGGTATRISYAVLLLLALGLAIWLAIFIPLVWVTLFSLLVMIPAIIIVLTGKTAREFVLVLKLTGVLQLVFGLTLGFGLAF
ncbi:1,4-dihydroxy-2-naphthoate octaprenyltransferase [Mycetocola sp. BIGb0189]|uniref:1,4-dihydroxy-2-naphthoate polyprenyltransferase n=1 Tax=Mycetocola sp. BIGb0189 TaxID=2940604 RepID=UPI002167EE7C|nr:1,4-dihydroxy-2-naphthoate polyprenyltransferase [Mycetocola sp. BIGb0189]MCS4276390.1 1,4-dihydroxy-2-naphthoate octaprenyltransferase [Mycetocola sp. BIGb0189]